MAGTGGLTREGDEAEPLRASARQTLPSPAFGDPPAQSAAKPAPGRIGNVRPAALSVDPWVMVPVVGTIGAPADNGRAKSGHLPAPSFGGALPPLPFRAVNTPDRPGYDPGFQRHHLLPRQLLSQRCFGALMAEIGRDRVGFDDFRSNGLLLPATDNAALRIGLPMHRGPHRDYNALVIERVGQIEASWSRQRLRTPDRAIDEAVMRMAVLQKALRRRLLQPVSGPLRLNRFDPARRMADLAAIAAMVDDLWPATYAAVALPDPGFGAAAPAAAQPAEPSTLALAC